MMLGKAPGRRIGIVQVCGQVSARTTYAERIAFYVLCAEAKLFFAGSTSSSIDGMNRTFGLIGLIRRIGPGAVLTGFAAGHGGAEGQHWRA